MESNSGLRTKIVYLLIPCLFTHLISIIKDLLCAWHFIKHWEFRGEQAVQALVFRDLETDNE